MRSAIAFAAVLLAALMLASGCTPRPAATPPASETAQKPPPTTVPEDVQPPTKTEDTTAATDDGPTPVSSEDPVAEAQVVLEKYLAADLGHDGAEMKKYLGGQAKARFKSEVQGQEDLTVHSKLVTNHFVISENQIEFIVTVEWSAEGSDERQTQEDSYKLKYTEKGWLIFSTPEYPDSE